MRQLNLSRAFGRNARAGRGVRRRETPVRTLKSAFGGLDFRPQGRNFLRSLRSRGGISLAAQPDRDLRTRGLVTRLFGA